MPNFTKKECDNCHHLIRSAWKLKGKFLCYRCYSKILGKIHCRSPPCIGTLKGSIISYKV
jgi:hypothetical protein